MLDIDFFQNFEAHKCVRLYLLDGVFYSKVKNFLMRKFKPEVALVCCHGGEGENGALQGVLESNCVPYTSAGIMSSAVGMDKIVSKELFQGLLLNTVEEISVNRADFKYNRDKLMLHIETFLDYPIIVKPASLGSSIGIQRANSREELVNAIEVACAFDSRVIAERALTNYIELNCAVVSDGKQIIVSEVERPISWSDYLSFEDKYMNGCGKGMSECKRQLPAEIPQELYENVQAMSARVYSEMCLSGVVRIDYLLSENDKLYINEVNTIPGSLAFYLFEPKGISYTALLDMIIDGALYKECVRKHNKLAFDSGVLKNFSGEKSNRLQK
ncbi:MAG: D-alanine--D-alanine ligase [Clostridia bacterium]